MIESLEYHITDHCNLNCAGCSHFSPLAEPLLISYEQFLADWNLVYEKGLKIKRIRILGGEPLYHPLLGVMLKHLRKLFPNSDINVVTNAILLEKRKVELLPIFIGSDISLTVSRYPGLNLDYENLLNGFPKVEMYNKAGFWNISLHKDPDFDPFLAFNNCFSATCNYLEKGRIYPCPVIPNLHHFINYFDELKDTKLGQVNTLSGGITITDHSVEEIENFLKEPNPVCAHCNSIRARQINTWRRSEKNIGEWME